jgi:hypothetical protein
MSEHPGMPRNKMVCVCVLRTRPGGVATRPAQLVGDLRTAAANATSPLSRTEAAVQPL